LTIYFCSLLILPSIFFHTLPFEKKRKRFAASTLATTATVIAIGAIGRVLMLTEFCLILFLLQIPEITCTDEECYPAVSDTAQMVGFGLM
jgi:hypothetical protein